jgi:dCTP deaminase
MDLLKNIGASIDTAQQGWGILPDHRIRELAQRQQMIAPFLPRLYKDVVKTKEGIPCEFMYGPEGEILCSNPLAHASYPAISYGLSSFGYDIRVANEFQIFTPATGQLTVVDPKAMDIAAMVYYRGDVCIIPPNSFALARTVEYFKIPRNVLTICLGKSTYARIGVIVNVTPFEPEWEGHVTIEISNTTPLPCKIYANEGIAQVLFFEGEAPEVSYADRKGKYQAQTGITLPKI